MPSKVMSKTVTSSVSKETCLGVCLKSCKILKNSCSLERPSSEAAERFITCLNNQNDLTVTTFHSNEVQHDNRSDDAAELMSDSVVLQNSMPQVDFHQSNDKTEFMLNTSELYLTTVNHTSTDCNGTNVYENAHNNAGDDNHLDVLQFTSSVDHNEITDVANYCDGIPFEGQHRKNDRSDINIFSYNVAEQDALLQMDEGAFIFSVQDQKGDILSLSEVLTNSDDPWLGLNLPLNVHNQEYEFEPFFPYSECAAALASNFFSDLPSLLDSECATWLLSSPMDIDSDKPVTLVLDLDETLVHTSESPSEGADFSFQLDQRVIYVQKRPFIHSFLERVSELFQIIIFTAGTRKYADCVLDMLDPESKLFSRRAYRDSCMFSNNGYTKDLTVLGVDLAKLALVDNTPSVFHELQLNNGIPIKSWIGDQTDQELLSLLPFLETLACANDVRPFIAEKFRSSES